MLGGMSDSATTGRRLVFGATGYIGTNLVPRLLAEGVPVRASARARKVLDARGWEGVEIVEADALKSATLGPALTGIDIAYYLVHSMGAGRGFGSLVVEKNLSRALDADVALTFEPAGVRCRMLVPASHLLAAR